MKATIEPTTRAIEVSVGGTSIPARVWEGRTDGGLPLTLVVVRVAALASGDNSELEAALLEMRDPAPELRGAWPARLVLP